MNPQTGMEALNEGAKAVNKFEEIIQKIFGPRWTKKQADADEYADEKKLQTIRNNPDMDIVYINGIMSARKCTPEALAYRAEQRQLVESIRQEQNIENVIEIAANEIAQTDDSSVSDEPVDDDWLTRLFQIVKDINSKEMQFVWGKILAGEIIQPSSFSFRTLETVRNLSQFDAETFQKIIPLVITHGNTHCIMHDASTLRKYGVEFSDILTLDESGLIKLEPLGLKLYTTDTDKALVHTDDRIIIITGLTEEEREITLKIYKFTKAGSELYSILSHPLNEPYIFDVADQFIKQNKTSISKVTVHEINSISDTTIDYKDAPIKQFTI